MRIAFSVVLVALYLASCGERSTKTDVITSAQADTLCFQQIMNLDSTFLQLIFTDSLVTGELAVLPFEKDRARGTLNGIRSGNEITADWQRSGEGITQSYQVIFTLEGDSISWWEGERIQKDGKWILNDPQQGYQYKLTKADCR
jgi:hypothetical protein